MFYGTDGERYQYNWTIYLCDFVMMEIKRVRYDLRGTGQARELKRGSFRIKSPPFWGAEI